MTRTDPPTMTTTLTESLATTTAFLHEAHRQLSAARVCPLTGLLTRGAWERLAGEWLRDPAGPLGLVLVDLDRLKEINDLHGHAAGDDVLRETGRRILAWLRTRRGLAGRLGGDEFAILLQGMIAPDLVELETLLDQDIQASGGHRLPGGAALGAVHCTEPPTCTLPAAIRAADTAMYAHKRARRSSAGRGEVVRPR